MRDGEIIAAAQEERFTRKKHDASFPDNAIEFCLKTGGIPSYNTDKGSLRGLDGVVDKDKTAALLGRIIKAQEYFIITDVDNIFLNYNKPEQTKIDTITYSDTIKYLNE